MGQHHSNGLSLAKERGEKIIKVVDLGDEYALAGIRLETAFDTEKEHLCVLLVMDAGRKSIIAGLQVVPTVLAEIGRISIADLKAGIAGALSPKVEQTA